MSNNFLGQIQLFPYTFAPYGWADCAGQLLPISQYSALFSLLGTYYGGDGVRTFGLPDLQGRVALNFGQSSTGTLYDIGEMGGSENVTILSNEMAAHSHNVNATTTHATTDTPTGNFLAAAQAGGGSNIDRGKMYNAAKPDTALKMGVIAPAGGNLPHNNIQPYLVLRYCIALSGVFPSRS
jgi:microcystin-dependent protein